MVAYPYHKVKRVHLAFHNSAGFLCARELKYAQNILDLQYVDLIWQARAEQLECDI